MSLNLRHNVSDSGSLYSRSVVMQNLTNKESLDLQWRFWNTPGGALSCVDEIPWMLFEGASCENAIQDQCIRAQLQWSQTTLPDAFHQPTDMILRKHFPNQWWGISNHYFSIHTTTAKHRNSRSTLCVFEWTTFVSPFPQTKRQYPG